MSRNETNVPDQVMNGARPGNSVPVQDTQASGLETARLAADLYCIFEIGAVFACGLAAAHAYVSRVLNVENYLAVYVWPLLLLPLTYGVLSQRAGLQNLRAIVQFSQNAGPVLSHLAGAFITMALVGVILSESETYSRIWYGLWIVTAAAVVLVSRAGAARLFGYLIERGHLKSRVVLFGEGQLLKQFCDQIDAGASELDVIGRFGQHCDDPHSAMAEINTLIGFCEQAKPDMIIISLPENKVSDLAKLLDSLSVIPTKIKLVPPCGLGNLPLYGVSSHGLGYLLDLKPNPISNWNRVIKAIEDYLIASLVLIVTLPVMILVAVAIKLESRGPVLYTQWRNGLCNRPFRIYKFRTMRAEADDTFRQADRGDSRVTRVGRFLRRTSIDEVPQLFNVLRGEMSVVGPRPHPIKLNEQFADLLPLFNKRHSIKPGITGWAQVNDHRGPTLEHDDMRRRLESDLYYVDNWSIWLDFSIIAATPFVSVLHKNAL